MAQESWKESDETECQKREGPILCANNCGFFGSATTNNLCSKCHRDLLMKQQLVATSVSTMAEKMYATTSTSVKSEIVLEKLDKAEQIQVFNVGGSQSEDIPPNQPANRCLACRKRVGLVGFKCRCGGTFCSAHRYSETHECSFDYRTAGREAIAKANPVVKAEKIEKI